MRRIIALLKQHIVSTGKSHTDRRDVALKTQAELQRINAEIEKVQAETKKTVLDSYKTILGIISILASGFGIVIVVIYCIFLAHFFPTGLTIGDTLFFLFASIGIALSGLVISGVGMLPFALWMVRPRSKNNTQEQPVGDQRNVDISSQPCEPDIGNTFLDILKIRFAHIMNKLDEYKASSKANEALLLIYCFIGAIISSTAITCLFISQEYYFAIIAATLTFLLLTLPFLRLAKLIDKNKTYWPQILVSYVTLTGFWLFAALIFLLSIDTVEMFNSIEPIIGTTLGGFTLLLGLDLLDSSTSKAGSNSKRQPIKAASVFIVLSIAIPFLFSGNIGSRMFRNASMGTLGVFSDRTVITVDKNNLQILEAVAASHGVPLLACRQTPDISAVSNVRVWWHGIGNTSLIELLPTTDSEKGKGIRVQLASNGVWISNGPPALCFEMTEGIFFESNKANISKESLPTATGILDDALTLAKPNDVVVITGHADQMPRSKGKNDELATERACAVGQLIFSRPSSKSHPIFVKSGGARQPLKECSTKEPIATQRECNSINRRVEIRIISADHNGGGAVPFQQQCHGT